MNVDEMLSFAEVSLRAQGCPMPLNLDVWDGLLCGYGCKYCFADSFRASLYSSFFDNYKSLKYRHCNPDYYKAELDKLMKYRDTGIDEERGAVANAIALEIPMRFGIRFEDFLPIEGKKKIALRLLRYLAEVDYPVMINTKSNVVARDEYVKALTDNKGKAAVHVTMISSNDELLKKLEPGAPSFEKRVETCKTLVDAGIRVVARIEPFMVFLTDDPDEVQRYVEAIKGAGVRHITWDTYSYSANNPGIRRSFRRESYDFYRMFLLMSDSQWLGSFILNKAMDWFRELGDFSCSTFDFGTVTDNDNDVCCEVGDWFNRKGFNYGNILSAARFIKSRKGERVTWSNFKHWCRGFLSKELHSRVHRLWNLDGDQAYTLDWIVGMERAGSDGNIIWRYSGKDFREDMFESMLKKL